ncbi:MAG TPA: hypothetical protein GXX46_07380 [Peptococcaceae bacterium]|nr:hypothetical protein [Peptococcaceae bacterium]
MRNAAGVRHYFTEAFTPYGYISLLPELLREVEYTYLLTGVAGTGKSTMIKLIGIQLLDRGYDLDYIRSAKEPDSVAGLFLPKQKIAVLDKDEFLLSNLVTAAERQIDLNAICRRSKLEIYEDKIAALNARLSHIEQQIIKCLQEDYRPETTLLAKLPQEAVITIDDISTLKQDLEVKEQEENLELDEIAKIVAKIKKNRVSFYFLHSLQLDGWLNLAPRFIKEYDRICLEGDKSSQILEDILQEVKALGQVLEIIVHPLKPYTLIGIVFPDKNLTVWKGNPCKLNEQGFRKTHSEPLQECLEIYKKTKAEIKSLITECISYRGLDELRSELMSGIMADLRKSQAD